MQYLFSVRGHAGFRNDISTDSCTNKKWAEEVQTHGWRNLSVRFRGERTTTVVYCEDRLSNTLKILCVTARGLPSCFQMQCHLHNLSPSGTGYIGAIDVYFDRARLYPPAMLHLMQVVHSSAPYVIVDDCANDVITYNDDEAMIFPLLSPIVPLKPIQCKTVLVMRRLESTPNTQLGPSPVCMSDHISLVYDLSARFCRNTSTLPEPLRFTSTGMVLHNATGSGKTAVTIALASQDEITDTQRCPSHRDMKATLVCVPVNLVGQWKREINKFWPAACVHTIADIRQFKKLKPSDFKSADFIVVSYSFLSGKSYNAWLCEVLAPLLGTATMRVRQISPDLVKHVAQDLHSQTMLDRNTQLVLESFNFRRIILDEIHEIVATQASTSCRTMVEKIKSLSSKNLWGLTATPPGRVQQEMYTRLFYECDIPSTHAPRLIKNVFHAVDRNSCYPFREHCHLVTPSPVEQAVILTFDTIVQAVMACTSLRGCVSGDDAEDAIVTANSQSEVVQTVMNQLARRLANLRRNEASMVELVGTLVGGTTPDLLRRMQARLDHARRDIQTSERHQAFLTTVTEGTSSEPCVICYDAAPDTMLSCGHQFCLRCATRLRRQQSYRCATCRHESARLYRVEQATGDTESAEQGCKFAELMKLLRLFHSSDESVVIFTQWSKVMSAAAAYVEKHVPVLQLKGNVHARNKTLQVFEERPVCTLFLSLENSSSGLNLIKANRVIFLHAITTHQPREVELQAIARVARMGQTKDVTVHHIIADGTCERDLFENTTRNLCQTEIEPSH